MSPKALVTGTTGFIGSHLVETLVAQNWDVTCLVRSTSRIEFIKKFLVLFMKNLAGHESNTLALFIIQSRKTLRFQTWV